MPSLIDIRRRIRSVKNTQQITKAMKMVSAAKLRRAQDRVIAARPYAAMLRQMLANVAAAAADDEEACEFSAAGEPAGKAHSAAAGDGGSRPGRRVQFEPDQSGAEVRRKSIRTPTIEFEADRAARAATSSASANAMITGEHIGILYQQAGLHRCRRDRAEGHRALRERRDRRGLPDLQRIQERDGADADGRRGCCRSQPPASGEPIDYIYEQPPAELLASLLPRYVEIQVYRAMLESAAAEHAARMTAMDAAIVQRRRHDRRLTLYMNRVRQASITREIIEVVSGASALE